MTSETQTESELLFEAFCRRGGIRYKRVPQAKTAGEQSPDYVVWLGSQEVIVEVKQFDPNAQEKRAAAAMARGEVVVLGPKRPGDRVWSAIHGAAPQLKARSQGRLPTMVVVYNNTVCSLHTKPEAMSFAMDGIEVVPVVVPHDPDQRPTFGQSRSGPKKMLTPQHNTTISAVGVLCFDWNDTPVLLVYHNRHARHGIDSKAVHASLQHYRRPRGVTSGLDAWEKA